MNVTELINLLESMPDDATVAIDTVTGPHELAGAEYDADTDAVLLSA